MVNGPIAVLLTAQHLAQAALCIHGGLISRVAIEKLSKYQKEGEEMAKWSPTAEYRYQMSRSTQVTGAVALLVSFIVSVALAFFSYWMPRWLSFSLSPVMLVFVLLSRGYIKNFWAPGKDKSVGTRIPLPHYGDYNEAQRQTEKLLKVLEYLEYSWVAASFVNARPSENSAWEYIKIMFQPGATRTPEIASLVLGLSWRSVGIAIFSG